MLLPNVIFHGFHLLFGRHGWGPLQLGLRKLACKHIVAGCDHRWQRLRCLLQGEVGGFKLLDLGMDFLLGCFQKLVVLCDQLV